MFAAFTLRGFVLLTVLSVAVSCNPFRRSRPQLQLPPLPIPEAKTGPDLVDLPEPPPVELPSISSAPSLPIEPMPEPEPPPADEPKPAKRPAAAAKSPPPGDPDPPADQPQPAAPRLTQLLSPAEAQTYRQSIETMLARAEENFGRLAGIRLTTDQQANLDRARGFVKQAQQAREGDLVTAHSLAQRADVLAQDLVRNVNAR
jgi:hypothetical protein